MDLKKLHGFKKMTFARRMLFLMPRISKSILGKGAHFNYIVLLLSSISTACVLSIILRSNIIPKTIENRCLQNVLIGSLGLVRCGMFRMFEGW